MFQIAFIVLAGLTFVYYAAFVSNPQFLLKLVFIENYTYGRIVHKVGNLQYLLLVIFLGMEKEKTKWQVPTFQLKKVF